MYTSEKNIDVLFLGSSHCMRTFDCEIGDKLLQYNTFNGGTSSQFLDGSYAMLVEAGKNNTLKEVWVELYYGQLGRLNKERTEMTATYILSDYMPFSFNKLRYLLLASSSEYYVNSFMPIRRTCENIFEEGYTKSLVNKKQEESYKNYDYVDSYLGKGFIGSDSYIESGTYMRLNDFWPAAHLTEDDKENLQNIIGYCEKNRIELHFFSAPMSDFRLVSLNNYDDYVTEISEYLKENGYDYYDFNLCKPEYLNLNESDYIDDNHLNKLGADKVTNLICKIINEQVDIEDIFELSYNVKISKQVPKVYGVQVFTTTNEENTIYEIAPVANAEEEFYYTINDSGANGEVKLIQEMDTNNIFIIPNSEKGVILIDVWVNGEITNSVKVPYGE